MEEVNTVVYTPGGDCIYIGAAPVRGELVAMSVIAELLPLVTRVHHGERFMYIDFGFKTAEARVPTMRVGTCHMPPEGGHNTA